MRGGSSEGKTILKNSITSN